MEKQLWNFYYQDEYRNKHYIHAGKYKKPQRTKYYKLLEQMFNAGVVDAYGIERIYTEND